MLTTVLTLIGTTLSVLPGFVSTAEAFYRDLQSHPDLTAEQKAAVLAARVKAVDETDAEVQAVPLPRPTV